MPHTKRTEIRTRDDSRKNGVSGRQPCGRLPNHRLTGRKPFKYPLGHRTRARLSSKVPPLSTVAGVAPTCSPTFSEQYVIGMQLVRYGNLFI